MTWWTIVIIVIISYLFIGFLMQILNKYLSKKKFLKLYDSRLDEEEQRELWDKCHCIGDNMDVPWHGYVFMWPLVIVGIFMMIQENKDEYREMKKTIKNLKKENPEHFL